MALMKCSECGNDVSSEAKSCPHCGAKVKKPKAPMSLVKKLGILAAVLFVWSVVRQASQDEERRAARTPEQVAADKKEAAQEVARSSAVQIAVDQLRKSVRDPDSLVIESARASADPVLVCIEYRAKNGFGGMSKEFVVFTEKKTYPNNGDAWNKQCRKAMRDYTSIFK
jgi:DNA-directed RNA polymerase subunit RPC12/RpoP